MEEIVSVADATRKFSFILRRIREGRSYVVTSHGQPVARIVPVGKNEKIVSAARRFLLSRLESQTSVDAGRYTRDELYNE